MTDIQNNIMESVEIWKHYQLSQAHARLVSVLHEIIGAIEARECGEMWDGAVKDSVENAKAVLKNLGLENS